jgi:hypothetical protein
MATGVVDRSLLEVILPVKRVIKRCQWWLAGNLLDETSAA